MYEIFEELLVKFNVTAYKVSKETGVPQSTLSSWKSKKNKISPENAEILAKYFNVSIDYLMTGIENEQGSNYYLNDETKEIAQEIFDNPDLRLLYYASKGASSDDLKAVSDLLLRLKRKETNEE
jgi:transcriptional regulator with XRE-family HTH domain